ncbi:MAG TPA: Crp/Fnr family transcriptional regulator [Patescibacteria group bacterium]|nr:Crp/Fnr family transcriptional regulator [Patescibacteria group bacterium]
MPDKVAANFLKTFLERHPVRKFKKGEIIIFQGEAPRNAFAVKSGTVKAYNLSLSGDEKPVAFYPEGNVFPATWIYGKAPSAIYYYEAFTPAVEVYLLDKDNFIKFIKKSPELLYQELERMLSDQLGGSMRLNALQHSRASDKLIYTLHYLALTHGHALDKDNIEITLDLTHQDFANLTGLTRETAATELNKLKKLNIIIYGKHKPYTLNLKHLLQMVNDQFIADIKPATLQT